MAATISNKRARTVTDYSLLSTGDAESIYGGDPEHFFKVLTAKSAAFAPASDFMRPPLTGPEFTLEWVRAHGLRAPVKILDRAGMGMALPGPGFTVRDVADIVGPGTPIDVMDVASQSETLGWNLAMWADYFHGAKVRKAVLNVISLEFSGTPLERYVRAPRVVRQLDWIDNIWPAHRRASGQYPQVQLYCLMSVAGSWTDFHVDFGGTSVWYHVHTGRKTFLFVPPTAANLSAYERWTTSSTQSGTFFGDLADACFSVTVETGNTLILPTGWIHAVHTPIDSLVFGGNFLHGFDMPGQLRIYELELFTRVPRKYRFPYYEHMQWYAAAYYLQFTRMPGFGALLREAYDAADAAAAATASTSGVDVAGASPLAMTVALSSSRYSSFSSASSNAVTSSSAPSASSSADFARVTRQLHERGLSWAEITGLPSLVKTLVHVLGLMRGALENASSASAPASAAAVLPLRAPEAILSSIDAAAAATAAGGGFKLKLKMGGGGSSSSATQPPSSTVHGAVASTSTLAAPASRNRRAMRVKGVVPSVTSASALRKASGGGPAAVETDATSGSDAVDAADVASSHARASSATAASAAAAVRAEVFDEFDAFPVAVAALEAARMGDAIDQCDPVTGAVLAHAGPETLLAELTARLDVSMSPEELDAAWPLGMAAASELHGSVEAAAAVCPSVLRMHSAGPTLLQQRPPSASNANAVALSTASLNEAAPSIAPAAAGRKLTLKLGTRPASATGSGGSSGTAPPFSSAAAAAQSPAEAEDAALASASPLFIRGGANVPKGTVGNPPARTQPGGFGLYDGRVRTFASEGDDVSHPGSGYHYNEQGTGASSNGQGEDEDEGDGEADEAQAAIASAAAAKKRRGGGGDDDDEDYEEGDDDDEFDAGECRLQWIICVKGVATF